MSNPDGPKPATLDDLHRVDGRAELIAGRVIHLKPTGFLPGQITGAIVVGLMAHARATGRGRAATSTLAYAVPALPSGRQSFSPDASYYLGPPPANAMDFVPGPPTFAVEVRSKGDHGKAAEAEMAAKRVDYFAAGTRVVWDVDPDARLIHVYRADAPKRPETFGGGQVADAEPAVPGWRIAVDEVFA